MYVCMYVCTYVCMYNVFRGPPCIGLAFLCTLKIDNNHNRIARCHAVAIVKLRIHSCVQQLLLLQRAGLTLSYWRTTNSKRWK